MAKEITLRPEVLRFAYDMERKLQSNDHKGGWKHDSTRYLISRLSEEVLELIVACNNGSPEKIRKEAADVGNFAMMIAEQEGS